MKNVSGATNSESKSSSKGWACFAAVAVGLLFFLSLSAGNNEAGDPVVSGQAKQATHISEETGALTAGTTPAKSSKGWGWSFAKSQKDVEAEVEEEVRQAESDFAQAIAEQLALQQSTISLKIGSVMESTRQSLNTLLGDSDLVSSKDIDKLGNEIESKLNREVQKLLKEKTDDLLEKEDEEMEVQADLETEDMAADEETDADEIIVDLQDEEAKLLIDIREKIDEAVTGLLAKIKLMAGLIAKEMLELLLLEKTGTTYKVTLDDEGNLVSFKKRSSSTSTTGSTSSSKPKSSSSSSSSSSSGNSSSQGKTSSSTHKSSSSTSSTSKSSSTSSSTTKSVGKTKGKQAKADNDRRRRTTNYLR